MSVKEIIRKIAVMRDYRVLDIYDFDSESYLVSCENRKTGSRLGDFFFTVSKRSGDVRGYNPAENPFEYGEKIKKAKVLYSA